MPNVVENIKKPTIQIFTIIPLNTPPAMPSAPPIDAWYDHTDHYKFYRDQTL